MTDFERLPCFESPDDSVAGKQGATSDHPLRVGLRALSESGAVQESILKEHFWIAFLKKKQAAQFEAIRTYAKKQIEQLADVYPDKQSDAYLDELQKIIDTREASNQALIVELTEQAQQTTADG